jgi:hypothetical protein
MTAAVDAFSSWLTDDIAPFLKARGFSKAGSSFHHRGRDGWGIINLQKSQFGTREDVAFYVNVAVALDRLLSNDRRDPTRPPTQSQAHGRVRLGDLLKPPGPASWTFDPETDQHRLTSDVITLLDQRAVPFIEARVTESGFATALELDRTAGAAIRLPRDIAQP